MHAVLKCGAAYVPIDLGSPARRSARAVAVTEPRLALATPGAANVLDELAAGGSLRTGVGWLRWEPREDRRFALAFTAGDWTTLPSEPIERLGESEMAHILFTSRSTISTSSSSEPCGGWRSSWTRRLVVSEKLARSDWRRGGAQPLNRTPSRTASAARTA
jgi:non-ribosomal peptide synthetase component F